MKKVGIIGAGDISRAYLEHARDLKLFEVAGLCDLNELSARARAEEFSVPVLTQAELLALPLDAVINLTPPAVHAAVTKAALQAGLNVYSEKPLAVHLAEARDLLDEAARRGLTLGCAPDTLLGAGFQTAREVLQNGLIGRPVAASAFFLVGGPDNWHPNPAFFYQPGAGPLFDMGPYYLSALVNLLGSVRRVAGSTTKAFDVRTIRAGTRQGEQIPVSTPTHVTGLLEFESGVVATVMISFDVAASETPRIEVYGTEGTLSVPDPNHFGGPVRYHLHDAQWMEWPVTRPYADNSRGVGLAEMLDARAAGRPARASGEVAYHVLEVMHRILEAAEAGRFLDVDSRVTQPDLLPNNVNWSAVEPTPA